MKDQVGLPVPDAVVFPAFGCFRFSCISFLCTVNLAKVCPLWRAQAVFYTHTYTTHITTTFNKALLFFNMLNITVF